MRELRLLPKSPDQGLLAGGLAAGRLTQAGAAVYAPALRLLFCTRVIATAA